MATGGPERRLATAASRTAVLTVHVAAGLAWQADKDTAILLRAAEGLCRAAVAKLAASGLQPGSAPPTGKADEKHEEHKKEHDAEKSKIEAERQKQEDDIKRLEEEKRRREEEARLQEEARKRNETIA